MSGWQSASIGDLCDVVNGGTPKTGVPAYWGGPHRWITPAEMGRRSTPYIDQTARTITDEGIQDSSARLLPPYSVILSSRAPIGHLVINTEPMATNQGCKGLVPSERIDYKFLYYYLSSKVDLLNDLGTGTTFKELSGGKLKAVLVPVPALSEQRRIVAILDEAFEGIAAVEANTAKSVESCQNALETNLTSIMCDPTWEWRTLGDLCHGVDYGSAAKSKAKGSVPVLRMGNIQDGRLDWSNLVYTDDEAEIAKYLLRFDDVLFNRTNSPELVGKTAV